MSSTASHHSASSQHLPRLRRSKSSNSLKSHKSRAWFTKPRRHSPSGRDAEGQNENDVDYGNFSSLAAERISFEQRLRKQYAQDDLLHGSNATLGGESDSDSDNEEKGHVKRTNTPLLSKLGTSACSSQPAEPPDSAGESLSNFGDRSSDTTLAEKRPKRIVELLRTLSGLHGASGSQETLAGGSGFLSDWTDDDKADLFDPNRRKRRAGSMRSLANRKSLDRLAPAAGGSQSSSVLPQRQGTKRHSLGAESLPDLRPRDVLLPMRQQSEHDAHRGVHIAADARAVPPRSKRRIDLADIYSSILGTDWEAVLRPPPPKPRKPAPPATSPHPLLRTLSRHNTNLDLFEIDRLMWEQQRARAEHRRRRPQPRRRRSTSEGSAAAPAGWARWVASLLFLRQVATANELEDSESEDEEQEEDFVIEWERRRVVRAGELETPAQAQLRAVKAAAEALWDAQPASSQTVATRTAETHSRADHDRDDSAYSALPPHQLVGPAQLAAVLRAAAPEGNIIGRPLSATTLSFTRGWSGLDGFPKLVARVFPPIPDRPEDIESKEMNVL
ncbi:hypothetical protein HDU87_003371 [Geranomyces variabilis]|uniref:Uncharacterized protein n=1 Tax=Geranomyces variabilis TaxID=109894 RepID=A0AAD5XSQ5_9FUNG|nr:hypothetical protein HDU87_003371 [Geranomyces variabilis]